MTDEYVYKISSRYLQKWLRYNMKRVIYRDLPNFIFWPILMFQKVF